MINYKSRIYGKTKEISLEQLKELCKTQRLSYLDVILLFGSRANGTARRQSDYDFAVYGDSSDAPFGLQAKAWMDLSMVMDVSEYDIDVVDLANIDDLMKDSIKSGFIVLKGEMDDISGLLG
jgi:predicted nucleotidyltransferase